MKRLRLDPAQEAVLKSAPLFHFTGIVTRFIWEHHRARISSPIGAHRNGGRYNPPGVPALYTSMERMTACAEFTQFLADGEAAALALMVSLILRDVRTIDLTDAQRLTALETSLAQVTAPRLPGEVGITTQIGASAHALGFDALLVWSAVIPTGRNLVLFPDRLPTLPMPVISLSSIS